MLYSYLVEKNPQDEHSYNLLNYSHMRSTKLHLTLDRLVVTPEELVITGDLNFHLDNKNNCDTRKFQETLRDHGLVQHVRGPTHNHGHTLDVVITRENSLILKTVPSVQDPSLCDRKGNPSGDHLALFSALEISKPPRERKEVTYRKLRNISTDDIIHDLVNSEIFQNQERPLEDLVNLYSTELSSILDKHAPLISKNLILRPNTEWYTDDLRVAKRNRRKAERRMRKTKLTIHRQMFRESCITTNQLLIKCKKDYFSSKVSEIGHDQKQLHRLTNDLMGNKREIFLPEHEDDKLLADKFCEFFVGKISIIRDSLSTTNTSSSDSNPMRADIKFEVDILPAVIVFFSVLMQTRQYKYKHINSTVSLSVSKYSRNRRSRNTSDLNAVRDNLQSNKDVTFITSGSFGEGLEMRGSDLDVMVVQKRFDVCEELKSRYHPQKYIC
ncbi:unnamed protein product [Mytilus edulis]|uniref:Endonuclease/exonuclease/phosphatase domain-containing protein n=1 Tax=Mytilus edulis TaxID=6550 RepID=A0A8S3QBA1_MYTED|nr:unnamed protein product [Mytilus edulis]